MPKLTPIKSEISTVVIVALAAATHIEATVQKDNGETATLAVPISATVGDQIMINEDGTLPTVAESFLSAAAVVADYLKVG